MRAGNNGKATLTETGRTSAIGCKTRGVLPRRAVLAGGMASLLALGARASFGQTQAFPVTVDHALGATVVPARPKRIVTVGWCDEDSVLAFGETPIAMVRRGMFESGIAPWCEERPGPLGRTCSAAARPITKRSSAWRPI